MAQYSWENCTEAVRKQVFGYIEQVKTILSDELVGVYLHGSLATGCFNPTRSDIDMLIVSKNQLSLDQQHAAAQASVSSSMQPCRFELSFLAADYLKAWEHPCQFDYHYSEDWREKTLDDLQTGAWKTWTQPIGKDGDLAGHITVLNHRGITLYGIPFADVFPQIPIEHHRKSILSDYRWLLEKKLGKAPYGILNMCRIWQHFEEGTINSKDEGGVWALSRLPQELCPVVETALHTYREDAPFNINDDLYQQFERFIADQSSKWFNL